MPEYTYECEACQHTFDIRHSIHDKPKKRCPKCHKHKLFIVVTAETCPMSNIKGDPKTIIHLAEKNREKCGHYEKEERDRKLPQKKKKYKPWWRKSEKIDTSLSRLTPKQKEKYINEGKKPNEAD